MLGRIRTFIFFDNVMVLHKGAAPSSYMLKDYLATSTLTREHNFIYMSFRSFFSACIDFWIFFS